MLTTSPRRPPGEGATGSGLLAPWRRRSRPPSAPPRPPPRRSSTHRPPQRGCWLVGQGPPAPGEERGATGSALPLEWILARPVWSAPPPRAMEDGAVVEEHAGRVGGRRSRVGGRWIWAMRRRRVGGRCCRCGMGSRH
jgi:hypothetical protein